MWKVKSEGWMFGCVETDLSLWHRDPASAAAHVSRAGSSRASTARRRERAPAAYLCLCGQTFLSCFFWIVWKSSRQRELRTPTSNFCLTTEAQIWLACPWWFGQCARSQSNADMGPHSGRSSNYEMDFPWTCHRDKLHPPSCRTTHSQFSLAYRGSLEFSSSFSNNIFISYQL